MKRSATKGKGRIGSDDIRPEYDFDYSKGVRGKYYRRLLAEGSSVVLLDPDVAKAFRSSAAVNAALRGLLELASDTQRATSRRVAHRRGKTTRRTRR